MNDKILYALLWMYIQYCSDKGHLCMSAGEVAFDVLLEEGLIESLDFEDAPVGRYKLTEKGEELSNRDY